MNFKNKKVIIGLVIIVIIIGFAIANSVKQNNLLASELERFTTLSKEFEKSESREDKIEVYNKEIEFKISTDLNNSKTSELSEVINEKTNKDLTSLTDVYDSKVSKLTLKDKKLATNKELKASIDGLKDVNKMSKEEALLNEEDLKTFTDSNIKLIKSYNAQIYTNKISSLNKSIKAATTSSKTKELKTNASDLKAKIEKDSYLTKDSKTSLTESINKTIKSANSKYSELKKKEDEAAAKAEAERVAQEQAAAQAAAAQSYSAPETNSYSGSSNSGSYNSGSSNSTSSSSNSAGSSESSSSNSSNSSSSTSSSGSGSCTPTGLCAGDWVEDCDVDGNCTKTTLTQDYIDEVNGWLGAY